MNDDWWNGFFSGLVVDFWRAAMTPEMTKAEADLLTERLRLAPGHRVLDVPCGDGRLALALAQRGCRVTGVDISQEFLDAGRAQAQARGVDVSWLRAEMRDLPWREEFEAAYCAGSSFGYLDDAGNADFLSAVSRALVPGGRFFIDCKAGESIFPSFRDSYEMTVGDIRFASVNRYDPATGTMENLYTISRGDRVEKKRALTRIYSASEILRLLSDAGFGSFETYGSVEGEPFRLGSPRLLVIAQKSGI